MVLLVGRSLELFLVQKVAGFDSPLTPETSLLSQLPYDGCYPVHEFGRHNRDRATDRRTYEFFDHQTRLWLLV